MHKSSYGSCTLGNRNLRIVIGYSSRRVTNNNQGRTLGGGVGGCDTPPSFLKYVEIFGPETRLQGRKSVRLKSEKANILCQKEKN